MAASYYFIPSQVTDIESVSNSIHIIKVQSLYAILPNEICTESLKEIISNYILSKYNHSVITRDINKAMKIANNIILSNGWQNTIICLSTLYECLLLATRGNFKILFYIMDSISIDDSFAKAPYKKCNDVFNFITTISFLLSAFHYVSELKVASTRKFVLKSIIIYYMFILIEWINNVGEMKLCRAKLSNFMKTSHGRVDKFKSDINDSKIPKNIKIKIIDKLVCVKEQIAKIYNL
jgi:hypothetical protein